MLTVLTGLWYSNQVVRFSAGSTSTSGCEAPPATTPTVTLKASTDVSTRRGTSHTRPWLLGTASAGSNGTDAPPPLHTCAVAPESVKSPTENDASPRENDTRAMMQRWLVALPLAMTRSLSFTAPAKSAGPTMPSPLMSGNNSID